MEFEYLPGILARRFGDDPCIRDDNTRMSFRELDERVSSVAAQFRELGVTRGDVIAVMLPNRSELVELGRPPGARRMDTQLALATCHVLGSVVLSQGDGASPG